MPCIHSLVVHYMHDAYYILLWSHAQVMHDIKTCMTHAPKVVYVKLGMLKLFFNDAKSYVHAGLIF